MIVLKWSWKMLFISSKNLFSFLRYLNFCIFIFSDFFPVGHCFRGWSKTNLKVYDVINCLNKNLIIHFVWYFETEKRYEIETLSSDRVSNKEHFYRKIMQKMLVPDPFLILVNNPINSHCMQEILLKNKTFWKRIIHNT